MVTYDVIKLRNAILVLHSNIRTEDLGGFIEDMLQDGYVSTHIPHMAYILATAYWESDGSMKPIVEVRQVKVDTATRQRVRASQDKYWGTGYYGRGYVQLTWKTNYVNMSKHLHEEYPEKYSSYSPTFLADNPNLATVPAIAYDILSSGMRGGYFSGSGRGLSYYLNSSPPDYVNARRTVNGTDQAQVIANLAIAFAKCLEQASNQ